jgi:FkbM family methyltransferase
MRYVISRAFVRFPVLFSPFWLSRDGYRLRLTASNVTASMYYQDPNYLIYDELVIKKLLRKGDCFIDVGANVGQLSIVGKTLCGDGAVLSIEAHPKTFQVLKGNIRLNRMDIDAVNCAVSDKDSGTVEIQDSFADDCNSIVSEESASNSTQHKELYLVSSFKTYETNCRTLDSLVSERFPFSKIRLLKIDVEGYELFVIKGSLKVLEKTELIYFEYWDQLSRKYGYDRNELFAILEGSGFDIYMLPSNPSAIKQDLDNLRRVGRDTQFSEGLNLLAVKSHLVRL